MEEELGGCVRIPEGRPRCKAQEVLLLSNQTQVNCALRRVNMTPFHKNPFPPAVKSKSNAPAVNSKLTTISDE